MIIGHSLAKIIDPLDSKDIEQLILGQRGYKQGYAIWGSTDNKPMWFSHRVL